MAALQPDEEAQLTAARQAGIRRVGIPSHAPPRDHLGGDLVGLIEVVRGAAGDLVEEELLRRPPAHQRDKARTQVGLRRQVVVLLRRDGHAESFAMGKQRDLLDLPPVAVDLAADRVADFVCGDDRALALVHRPPSGRADGDLEPAGVQILAVDRVGRTARREDGRFVEHVSQLGSREAVRLARHRREIGTHGEWLVACVDLENLTATHDVGQADVDLSPEPAGPKCRRIEDVDPIRGRDHHDVVRGRKAIQFDQQLVQGLLTLLVAVEPATRFAKGVELIEEDDAPAELARVREQLANPPRSDANVFLHELGAGGVVKRDTGFGCHRAGEHRLACTWGPVEHDPAGDRAPSLWNRSGDLRNSIVSVSSSLASSQPATSASITRGIATAEEDAGATARSRTPAAVSLSGGMIVRNLLPDSRDAGLTRI